MGDAVRENSVGVIAHDSPLMRVGSSAGGMNTTCYLVEPKIEEKLQAAAALKLPQDLIEARKALLKERKGRGSEIVELEQRYRDAAANFIDSSSELNSDFVECHEDYIRAQCEFAVKRLCGEKKDGSKALRLIGVDEFLERVLDIKLGPNV